MLNFILSFFLTLLIYGNTAQARPTYCETSNPNQRTVPKPRKTVPTHLKNVVHIETECGYCTGWIAKDGVFVTAAHCFEEPVKHIFAKFIDGKKVKLRLIREGTPLSGTSDIAVLTGNTRHIKPMKLTTRPTLPAKCISIGYGMEHTQKSSSCFGPGLALSGGFAFAGAIDFGDSGGPIINAEGEVFAVQYSINADDTPIFYGVPVKYVYELLDGIGN